MPMLGFAMGRQQIQCESAQKRQRRTSLWANFTGYTDVHQWQDQRIIALLVLAPVLFIFFVMIQILMPQQSMISPQILKSQSIAAGFWTSICVGGHQALFGELLFL